MLTQIRNGIFETNSSSTHVLTYSDTPCISEDIQDNSIPDLETEEQWRKCIRRFRRILYGGEEIETTFAKYMYVVFNLVCLGTFPLKKEKSDVLSACCNGWANLIKREFKEKGCNIKLNVPDFGLPMEIWPDDIICDLTTIDTYLEDEVSSPKVCDPVHACKLPNMVEFVTNYSIGIISMDTDVMDMENPDDNEYNVKMYTKFYPDDKENKTIYKINVES